MPYQCVIGIDCATLAERTGLARARRRADSWVVDDVVLGSRSRPPAATLTEWLRDEPHTLIALDAPLGWPVALGTALVAHGAGDAIMADPAALFTRATDHAVRARYGKRPLDVGADRIARTARAALGLLAAARRETGHAIALGWDPSEGDAPRAIEVYPAATLAAHGLPSRQYKEPGSPARGPIVAALDSRLVLPGRLAPMTMPGDALDALLCVVAGLDFVEGAAAGPAPDERVVAEREGWIWVRG